MHARSTTLQSTPDQIPEIKRQIQERVLPALRLQPGFMRLLVLQDTQGKLVTLTLWATEADEQATFARAYLHDVLDEQARLVLKNSRSESCQELLGTDMPEHR